MQCACAILSYVACSALQYFTTLFHRRCDFGVGGGRWDVFENEVCVLILSIHFSEIFLILRRIDGDNDSKFRLVFT